MSASTCPVPTYECEFRIGQSVRIANPYAEEDPDRVFYVTAINWEYRTLPRWDITIASAEDIARGYGATDGFSPQDLIAVEPGHVILSPDEVRAMRDEGLERAALVAECHSDDRPRRYDMDWNDGYIDGCRGAASAIRALKQQEPDNA